MAWQEARQEAVEAAKIVHPTAENLGDIAAEMLAQAGQWTVGDFGLYGTLTAPQKLSFWASGGDRGELDEAKANTLPVPNPSTLVTAEKWMKIGFAAVFATLLFALAVKSYKENRAWKKR